MPDLNLPDPDPRDLDGTQPVKPVRVPAPIPQNSPALPPKPPKSGAGVRAAAHGNAPHAIRKNDQPQRSPRRRQDSGLYIPVWSLVLMLIFVVGISMLIVVLVLALGGTTQPGGEPVVVIITAFPSATAPIPQFAPTLAVPTLPGVSNPEVPQFPLEGPTLVPVVLSPTPITINIGITVRTLGESVRVRPAPSLDNQERFFAQPGEEFVVTAGPEQGSGLTWWRVRDPNDSRREGWIAANLIEAVPAP